MAPEKEPASPLQISLSLLGLLGSLWFFAWRSHVKQDTKKTVHPDYSPKPEDRLSKPDAPITTEHRVAPVSQTITCRCEHETPPWKRKLEYGATFIALGLLGINILLWCVTKKSLDLTRQGVKGTQAAIVSFQFSVDSDGMTLRTENHGRVIAENVTARCIVTRKEWPAKRLIAKPAPIEFPPEPLQSVANGGEQSTNILPIPSMTQPDWDAIGRGEQFFTIEQGSTSYGNGFGDIIARGIPCQSLLYLAPIRFKNGGSTNTGPQWVPCEQFDSRMTDTLESRRKAEAANQ